MKTFLLDNTQYKCPTNLKECNATQVGAVMAYQISLQLYASPRQRTLSKIALWRNLTGVSEKVIKKLNATQLERVVGMIAWAKNAKIDGKPFDCFEIQKNKFYLPAENLADTSCIELAMANIYYLALTREQQPNHDAIFSLLAILCRPERADLTKFRNSKDWTGDIREEYNSTVADERAKLFKENITPGIAKAILLFFEQMNNAFWKRYEELLGESEEKQLYQNGEGQITMLMDIAETGTFGDFEKVCKQNVHTIWLFVRDKKLKADAMAEQNNDDDGE